MRLFSSNYDMTLWGPSLSKIVPIKMTRKTIYERLKTVKTLRNRIAHHSRIIGHGNRTVAVLYTETIEAIGWFSPIMRDWVDKTNCVDERLTKKVAREEQRATSTAAAAATPTTPTTEKS